MVRLRYVTIVPVRVTVSYSYDCNDSYSCGNTYSCVTFRARINVRRLVRAIPEAQLLVSHIR